MDPSSTDRERTVSRAFVVLADTLVDDYDVIDLLDRLVEFSVQLLGADAAGIVLGDARREPGEHRPVDLEGRQVAGVDPHHAGAGFQRPLDFRGGVHLD